MPNGTYGGVRGGLISTYSILLYVFIHFGRIEKTDGVFSSVVNNIEFIPDTAKVIGG